MIVGGGEQSEILHLEVLPALVRQIYERPLWQVENRTPLAVDAETYTRAAGEMKEALARQGRPLAVAGWIPAPNFLLRGIPVVIG